VLLKNDGTLPLNISPNMTIAMIGPLTMSTVQMQGSYYGFPPYLHSPFDAAQMANLSVIYAPGADINSTNTTGFSAAMKAASVADIIIFTGGIDISMESEANVCS
jgi:beta-D-xylosidase 4